MASVPYETQLERARRRALRRLHYRDLAVAVFFSAAGTAIVSAVVLVGTSSVWVLYALSVSAGVAAGLVPMIFQRTPKAPPAFLTWLRLFPLRRRLRTSQETELARLARDVQSQNAKLRKRATETLAAAFPLLSPVQLAPIVEILVAAVREPSEDGDMLALRTLARSVSFLSPEGRERVANEFCELMTMDPPRSRLFPLIVIGECEWALTPSARPVFADRTIDLLKADDYFSRVYACAHLFVRKEDLSDESRERLAGTLLDLLTASDSQVAGGGTGWAMMLIECLPPGRRAQVAEAIVALTRAPEEKVRLSAIFSLGAVGWLDDQMAPTGVEARLVELKSDPSKAVQRAANRALRSLARQRKRRAKDEGRGDH